MSKRDSTFEARSAEVHKYLGTNQRYDVIGS